MVGELLWWRWCDVIVTHGSARWYYRHSFGVDNGAAVIAVVIIADMLALLMWLLSMPLLLDLLLLVVH